MGPEDKDDEQGGTETSQAELYESRVDEALTSVDEDRGEDD